KALAATNSDEFSRIFPDGTIPAIVFENLAPADEILLLTDHGKEMDRQPLNDSELSNACGELTLAGFSQDQIAAHLGYFHQKGKKAGKPNREYIQQRVNLARLPMYIREEFAKACDDADSSVLRITDIPALFAAFQADKKLGVTDGNGETLKAAWEKVMSATKTTSESLSAVQATKYADIVTSDLSKRFLMSVTKQGTYTP